MKLILPVGGNSTRYGLGRPKWLLTLPSGRLMIEEAVKGLNCSTVTSIVIIAIKGRFEQYISENKLVELLTKSANCPVSMITLDAPTSHQPETVYKGLLKFEDDFPFIVKDCDNYFDFEPSPCNGVCYVDLNNVDNVTARNKSFISFNDLKIIEKIIEKKVISSAFCVGGYSFASKNSYISAYNEIKNDIEDLYLSHIIFHMIAGGDKFYAIPVKNYIDWGTIREFKSYQAQSASLFLDFDGVLVENSSKFSEKPWSYIPLEDNLSFLSEFLRDSPDSVVIITTSRPSEERNNIKTFLLEHGIVPTAIITDLPHCKRLLVNDFSASNSYPTALAISVPRNLENLRSYISNLIS